MISSAFTNCLERAAKTAALVCFVAYGGGIAVAQSPRVLPTLPTRALGESVPEEFNAPTFAPPLVAMTENVTAPSDRPGENTPASAAPATTETSAESSGAATAAANLIAAAQPTTASQIRFTSCGEMVSADVVAFDQVYTYNRFGAFNPAGMMYALRADVEPIIGKELTAGNVQLRKDKRPRPIVLRVNEGQCLQVTFQNLLTPKPSGVALKKFTNQPERQPYTGKEIELEEKETTATRNASMHVNGLDYVNGPNTDDGANVGQNTSSLAVPEGGTAVYTWHAAKQGQYLLYSMGASAGNEGDNGQGGLGLFGSVNVEPRGSHWYRSQLTAEELKLVTKGHIEKTGHPVIDYDAVYPLGHHFAGKPILRILDKDGANIIHTDLNAIIVNPKEDCHLAPPSGTCGQNFREFTVIFHDEIKAVQAFTKYDEELKRDHSPLDYEVFHGVRDGFGINYGASGLGAIVVANRKKVGPARECEDCKFEEFFLESWVNGDPALVVSVDEKNNPIQALFPDDPSNVHHSYLNDPVRFRNLHIGAETHVFHLHAHQWLQSPRFEDSTYLDSQTISPGGSYTYEINYGGSGNRNLTPGDAIFHCHLYPHFAQGMWELWRVHDVFEAGTDDRRLPDAELGTTPNPAIVPLPNLAMAPMPDEKFKGFPFYIEAVAGKRPPQPPLDFDVDSSGIIAKPRDGGLPRHIILKAEIVDGLAAIKPGLLNDPVAHRVFNTHQYEDGPVKLGFTNESPAVAFARKIVEANIWKLDWDGTPKEKIAMTFHEGCYNQPGGGCSNFYETYLPDGVTTGKFEVNGMKRQPGAPFADPCRPDDDAKPTRDIKYRSAYIQFSPQAPLVVNKAKWHDRQGRIVTLEEDAKPTLLGERPAEPLFFRANSGDCIEFAATNLIPEVLNLDDFQIFTPTDIIGQHIHLVKFDVTSSDGAGNGWNYEDGTFSPGEVQERIKANNLWQKNHGGNQFFELQTNQTFGEGPDLDGDGTNDWKGAQTTVQRWWADPLLNNLKKDRTIRTVFTHDHFGPSSHQHHGFYGALVVEREGSEWTALDGSPLMTRDDGGPTSFAANIIDKDGDARDDSFREFNLAFADFAILYRCAIDGSDYPCAGEKLRPVNPPGREKAALPIALEEPEFPQPEAISAADPGTQLVNYRNEPIPLRVGQLAGDTLTQKAGPEGDLANVFSSLIHNDPYTPVLPAYEKDQTVVRLIQGAQEEQHVFNLHGYKWLFQPGTPQGSFSENNSGYRNGQQIGISEHFEFYLNQPQAETAAPDSFYGRMTDSLLAGRYFTDHLYSSAATDNLWDGQWGILRVYGNNQYPSGAQAAAGASAQSNLVRVADPSDPERKKEPILLARLPNNPGTATTQTEVAAASGESASGAGTGFPEPEDKPICSPANREYKVTALLARDLLPAGELVYNKKFQLVDPNAIMFVNDEDIEALKSEAMQPEPLILRASAGECVAVTLTNQLPAALPENDSWNMMPLIVPRFNFNQVRTSNRVGLHSQLVAVNTHRDDGAFVGYNPDSTIGPGESRTYYWYAGDRRPVPGSDPELTPMEFGATGLRDMGDVIKHSSHGAIGALIVEPQDATWKNPGFQRSTADIYKSDGASFREFVVLYQTDLSLQQRVGRGLWSGLRPLENMADTDDSEDSGMKAFNYRTEPFWGRLGVPVTTPPIGGTGVSINDFDLSNVLSSRDANPGCGGACGDPETPVFTAQAGSEVRFRVLDVAGHPRQHGFTLFGHHWNLEPWQQKSTVQGDNPRTFEIGSESGIGPTRHVNILTRAGGVFARPGDYLYRTQEAFQFSYGGLWGIFRVNQTKPGGF